MINIGDSLPEFTAKNQDEQVINSKNLLGKKIIFLFYPKALTPGCSNEVCNIRDNYQSIINQGVTIFGISADSSEKQKKFKEKHALPFDLIADENKEICEKFGVWQNKSFMGKNFMGIVRTTFIFNEKGECIHIIHKVKTKEHTQQIMDFLHS